MLKQPKCEYRKGMTLVEVLIVATIIGILCAMAIPNFTKIRSKVYRDKCITNLRRIATAKEHWSLETGAADTDVPTPADLDPYLKEDIWDEINDDLTTGHELVCPLDRHTTVTFATSYTINDVQSDPVCNIDISHVLP